MFLPSLVFLPSLLFVDEFPTVPALTLYLYPYTDVPDVVGVPQCCCWLPYICKHPCSWWCSYCWQHPSCRWGCCWRPYTVCVVSLTLLAFLLLIWRSFCCWRPRFCWRSCFCWHFYLPALRSRNSACKHARYSSVLYIAKSRGFPGNFAELNHCRIKFCLPGKDKMLLPWIPYFVLPISGGLILRTHPRIHSSTSIPASTSKFRWQTAWH